MNQTKKRKREIKKIKENVQHTAKKYKIYRN